MDQQSITYVVLMVVVGVAAFVLWRLFVVVLAFVLGPPLRLLQRLVARVKQGTFGTFLDRLAENRYRNRQGRS